MKTKQDEKSISAYRKMSTNLPGLGWWFNDIVGSRCSATRSSLIHCLAVIIKVDLVCFNINAWDSNQKTNGKLITYHQSRTLVLTSGNQGPAAMTEWSKGFTDKGRDIWILSRAITLVARENLRLIPPLTLHPHLACYYTSQRTIASPS